MMRSRNFQIFNIIFKERYREPTLELVIPTMLVSNIFISAFYERGYFELLGIVLSFIPIISVSETLAFALALRNIIFVTGDHVTRGSIISFLTMPIKREELFFFIYTSDIIFPLVFWIITTEIYLILSGIEIPTLLILTYIAGYFFVENFILFLTLIFKSSGISTLVSFFSIGIIFLFGGILNYYDILYHNYSGTYYTSFANPYVLWIENALGKNFISQIEVGLTIDIIIGIILLIISYIKFKVLEL
ncbi:hypothetical protein DFR86_01510 [Acidianus sulfidivorans JP7]|uniref:Uncharacterized protein n=1 Tax=Acidianus sulfidivorans JP7 TaxID=619593 RepID=A0A2U9IK01_9CREN|nr:hypothetical protein [Acidianus sulfidivorans]AWR96353.1 hypothetical protein DFR86_01510 [Acidianus sulfidivorans JP7]